MPHLRAFNSSESSLPYPAVWICRYEFGRCPSSHVASLDLLLPLIEAQFVLGLRCPFWVQFFAGQKLLNDQQLLHLLVNLCPLFLRSWHIEPSCEGLFLPHLHTVSHHLLEEQKLCFCSGALLEGTSVLTSIELFLSEFCQDLPLGKVGLKPTVVVQLDGCDDLSLDLLGQILWTRDNLASRWEIDDILRACSVVLLLVVVVLQAHVVRSSRLHRLHVLVVVRASCATRFLQLLHDIYVILDASKFLLEVPLLLSDRFYFKSIVKQMVIVVLHFKRSHSLVQIIVKRTCFPIEFILDWWEWWLLMMVIGLAKLLLVLLDSVVLMSLLLLYCVINHHWVVLFFTTIRIGFPAGPVIATTRHVARLQAIVCAGSDTFMRSDRQFGNDIHASSHTLILTHHCIVHHHGAIISHVGCVVRISIHSLFGISFVVSAHELRFLHQKWIKLVKGINVRCIMGDSLSHSLIEKYKQCTYLSIQCECFDVTEVLSEFLMNTITKQFTGIQLVWAKLVSLLLSLYQLSMAFFNGRAWPATGSRPRQARSPRLPY